jgi:hypothetical protein
VELREKPPEAEGKTCACKSTVLSVQVQSLGEASALRVDWGFSWNSSPQQVLPPQEVFSDYRWQRSLSSSKSETQVRAGVHWVLLRGRFPRLPFLLKI